MDRVLVLLIVMILLARAIDGLSVVLRRGIGPTPVAFNESCSLDRARADAAKALR